MATSVFSTSPTSGGQQRSWGVHATRPLEGGGGPSGPVFGREAGDRSPVSGYPTTLPSLSADQFGQLAARRREVDARFQEAMARGGAERTRIGAEGQLAGNQLRRRFARETRDGMGQLAGRGVARNPRQGGRFLRDQRDAETGEASELAREQAERRRALQMFLEDQRRSRAEELSRLDMDEVNMRADLGRLFPGAGWFG